jgi:hypothetical protein
MKTKINTKMAALLTVSALLATLAPLTVTAQQLSGPLAPVVETRTVTTVKPVLITIPAAQGQTLIANTAQTLGLHFSGTHSAADIRRLELIFWGTNAYIKVTFKRHDDQHPNDVP